jgi:hypothetical protein
LGLKNEAPCESILWKIVFAKVKSETRRIPKYVRIER